MENGICNGEAMLPFLYASAMLIALCVTFVFILPKLIRATLPYKDDFALEKLYFASHFVMRYRLPTTMKLQHLWQRKILHLVHLLVSDLTGACVWTWAYLWCIGHALKKIFLRECP